MDTLRRAIRLRSYDGCDEVEVDVAEPTSVERSLPLWLERLQLSTRDNDGNPIDWSIQDSHGNLVPPSIDVQELTSKEPYTIAPDLTPARA
jgi:hypothetical protein